LHALEHISFFFTPPPSAHRVPPTQLQPASWDNDTSAWNAPEVITNYDTSLTTRQVLSYYGTVAAALGFTAIRNNSTIDLPDLWSKVNGQGFTLTFEVLPNSPDPSYALNAWADPIEP
jgi:hypothetical protein